MSKRVFLESPFLLCPLKVFKCTPFWTTVSPHDALQQSSTVSKNPTLGLFLPTCIPGPIGTYLVSFFWQKAWNLFSSIPSGSQQKKSNFFGPQKFPQILRNLPVSSFGSACSFLRSLWVIQKCRNTRKMFIMLIIQGRHRTRLRPNLVNLFLIKLVRISGFSSLFLAIAVFSAHFAREC